MSYSSLGRESTVNESTILTTVSVDRNSHKYFEGERWRNMEKAGREHSAAGNAPGRSRTRAWEKAASARVAVNGCGMEPDPGNLAPRFPSSVSRTLTLAGALREL